MNEAGFIDERNCSEVVIDEKSSSNSSLNTKLPEIIDEMITDEPIPYEPKQSLVISDAAVLMAADGYGTGRIKGKKERLELK